MGPLGGDRAPAHERDHAGPAGWASMMSRLESWITAAAADLAAVLFVVAIVLLVLVILVGAALAARTRRRADHRETVTLSLARRARIRVAIARWIEEGRQLFNLWQESG